MENIQNYQNQDIVKKINVGSLLLSIILLACCVVLCYLSSNFENTMSSLLIFFGVAAACYALYLIIWRMNKQVYVNTNSDIVKSNIYYSNDDFLALKSSLENCDCKLMEKCKTQGEGTVQVAALYSKDGQFLEAQVLKYEPFEYKPQTEVIVMKGDKARNFIHYLKHC